MKKAVIILLGIFIFSCNQSQQQDQSEKNKSKELTEQTENFDWLLGNWIRLNEEEGKETFENWEKINETEYSGIGFTMQDGDTIKQENIRLHKVNGNWDLTVKVPDETESITFKGVSHSENEFTCENIVLDFPNKIKYWKKDKNLYATVSGGEMKISFEFEKLKEYE